MDISTYIMFTCTHVTPIHRHIDMHMDIHLPTHPPTHPPTHLSTYLPTYLPIYLSTHTSIYLCPALGSAWKGVLTKGWLGPCVFPQSTALSPCLR